MRIEGSAVPAGCAVLQRVKVMLLALVGVLNDLKHLHCLEIGARMGYVNSVWVDWR